MNEEIQYSHFYHKVPLQNISNVDFIGDVEYNYVGFGGPDQQPAPPVGFNLTFSCPEGKVFNHDWFATPFVMMTCQVKLKKYMTSKNISLSCRVMEFLTSQTGAFTSV